MVQQLACNSSSNASGLARICMGDDVLAGPCTDNVGVANSVAALWLLGGGAWVVCILLYVHLRGICVFPLPSPKIAPSLSHSPLPVLSIFELHGAIRHNGAV